MMNQPLPRRRRFTLSLRSLMILVLVVGGFLGWKARRASIQRRAVEAITKAGGMVVYDYQLGAPGPTGSFAFDMPPNARPWAPVWLRRVTGEEFFQEVNLVYFSHPPRTEPRTPSTNVFEAVASLDRVDTVFIEGSLLNDGAFAQLMAMPRLSRASLINLDITDAGLECLASSPAIEELRVSSKRGAITARGLEAIARQPRIKNLEIMFTDLTEASMLAPLAKLTRLEYLNLDASPSEEACLEYLRNLTELKQIDLRRTQLTDAGIEKLAKLDKLERLLIDGSKLTDAGLAKLASFASLKEMYVDPLPEVTDLGLASLGKLKAVTALHLVGSNVTDAGLTHLKGLNLEFMTLSGEGVTDAGIVKLSETCQLRYLNLAKTSITGKGLGELANRALITRLLLDGSKVDDAGAAVLATFPALHSLSLENTTITDVGLASLQQLTTLHELDLRGTKVTSEGVAAFRKARPGVTVNLGSNDENPSR